MASKLSALPNLLTLGRIALVAPVMWGILDTSWTARWVAMTAFVVCIITDYLDGWLARKLDAASDFGRMLDPIADKILIAGSLIALSIFFWDRIPFPWILPAITILLLTRDFLVSGARELAAHKGRTMPPLQIAKWKTAFEMLAVLLILIGLLPNIAFFQPAIYSALTHAGMIVLIIATLMSLYTGFIYVRRALAP